MGLRIAGIDPGLSSGAMAIVEANSDGLFLIDATEIPTIGEDHRKRIDVRKLSSWLAPLKPDHAIIERAQVMPQIADENGFRRAQGASSGFKYGRAVGMIEAMVLMMGLPLSTVEPRRWKSHFNLKGGKENKDAARQLAIRMFGEERFKLKKHHNIAEAALIAYHAAEFFASREQFMSGTINRPPLAAPKQIDLWGGLEPGGDHEASKGDARRGRRIMVR